MLVVVMVVLFGGYTDGDGEMLKYGPPKTFGSSQIRLPHIICQTKEGVGWLVAVSIKSDLSSLQFWLSAKMYSSIHPFIH